MIIEEDMIVKEEDPCKSAYIKYCTLEQRRNSLLSLIAEVGEAHLGEAIMMQDGASDVAPYLQRVADIEEKMDAIYDMANDWYKFTNYNKSLRRY